MNTIEGLVYAAHPQWATLFRPCAVCGTPTKMGARPNAEGSQLPAVPICGSCWQDRPKAVRYVALERPLSRSNCPEAPEGHQALARDASLVRSNAPRTDEEAPTQAEVRPGGDRAVQGRVWREHHPKCPCALAWDVGAPCECPPGWPRREVRPGGREGA